MASKINFSPSDVLAIRQQYAAGALSVMAWADARGCAPETIRRIARGETHRTVGGVAALPALVPAPTFVSAVRAVEAGEAGDPDDAAMAASMVRLQNVLAQPDAEAERAARASALVDELRGKAGLAQPDTGEPPIEHGTE